MGCSWVADEGKLVVAPGWLAILSGGVCVGVLCFELRDLSFSELWRETEIEEDFAEQVFRGFGSDNGWMRWLE